VVPSFRHYLPPAFLPDSWSQAILPAPPQNARASSQSSSNTIRRDETCRVSNHVEQTEAAHIIPLGESKWFDSTEMSSYMNINSPQNYLLLRSDIHQLWDQRQFSILPRRIETEEGESVAWVAYVTKQHPREEVVRLYHDVCLQPLRGVESMALFCRFAWHVLQAMDAFLRKGIPRWLTVIDLTDGTVTTRLCTAKECADQNFTRRGRSQSPKKRPLPEDRDEQEDEDSYCGGSESSAFSRRGWRSSVSMSDSDFSEENRGRKRRRCHNEKLSRGRSGKCLQSLRDSLSQ